MKITTVGLDLAKSVFTLHGVDEHGSTVLRKTVRRAKLLELFAQLPGCVVGMLDDGMQGWFRTGYTFSSYATSRPGWSPVCRYYLPPASVWRYRLGAPQS